MRKEVDNETPIVMITVGDLKDVISETLSERRQTEEKKERRLVYGIRGIERLLGVSHKTAQDYKNTILGPAVMQNGRKIVVDADLALELFNKSKSK